MIPNLLRLLLEKGNIFPSEDIIKLVEKESSFAIPKFLDVIVDIAHNPDTITSNLYNEANNLIETIINSSICFEMLRHIFTLQGQPKDRQIKTENGYTIVRALPEWKQKAFDRLIRRISYKQGGIRQLMLTLMDLMGSAKSQKAASMVARCICRPPTDDTDHTTHYEHLSLQITDLVQISSLNKIITVSTGDKDEHSEYLRFSQCVALECINLYCCINKNIAQRFLLDILFVDFYRITDTELLKKIDMTEIIVLNGDKLLDSLNLHHSLLSTEMPCQYIQRVLRGFSNIYMKIATVLNDQNNRLTSVANQILIRLIELISGSASDTLTYIRSLVQLETSDNEARLHDKLQIRPTLDRQSVDVVLLNTFVDDTNILQPSEALNRGLLILLNGLSSLIKDDTISNLFLWLLKCRFDEYERPKIVLTSNVQSQGLVDDFRDDLLSLLCTEMESHCFSKSTDILHMAQIVVTQYSNGVLFYEGKPDEQKRILNDNLRYALSMIVCVLETGNLKVEDKRIIKDVYPLLQGLRDSHPLESMRDMVTDISIIIATQGHVNFLSTSSVIEEMDDCIDEQLKEAFIDIASNEVPLQAHGLVVICNLLKSKNESAIKNRNKIFNILSSLLFHSDSFVYLRAIGGLAVIGDQYTEKMLPMIAQRVRSCRGKHSLLPGIQEGSSLEDWMKLSEVFMKIIGNLGETAPMYRDVVLSALMAGLVDEEDVIRASSMSNLAELCCQTDYVLSAAIYEVVNKACDMLVSDRSGPVRSAASLFVRRLLLGNNDRPRPDVMTLFPGEVLLSIYRALKTVLATETDQVVVAHVSAAYSSLDESVRLFVFPPKSNIVEKRIRILDL